MKFGFIFRLWSFWVGLHYSHANRRVCFNPLPCVTFWMTFEGGVPPREVL
jgi:hypothetical protein